MSDGSSTADSPEAADCLCTLLHLTCWDHPAGLDRGLEARPKYVKLLQQLAAQYGFIDFLALSASQCSLSNAQLLWFIRCPTPGLF